MAGMAIQFYHGSRTRIPVGRELTARTNAGWFPKTIEDAVEAGRPPGVPSRLSSFFLVDERKLITVAGGSTDYIYRVTPVGLYSKNHHGWMGNVYSTIIPFIRQGGDRHEEEKYAASLDFIHIGEWVHNYWDGVPYQHRPRQAPTSWEYLAPVVFVEEEIRAPFGL